MTIQQVESEEADTREIIPNVDTRARESLGNILRTLLVEGLDTLLKSKSKTSEDNVLAATTTSVKETVREQRTSACNSVISWVFDHGVALNKTGCLQNIEHRTEGVPGKTIIAEPTWVSYFSPAC